VLGVPLGALGMTVFGVELFFASSALPPVAAIQGLGAFLAEPAHWGIHLADPAPWNRLLGPVHARGGVSGVILQAGRVRCAWGEPHRADLTFSVAKTYLALLAGLAHARGLLPDPDVPVVSQLPGIGIEGLIQSSNRVLARGLPGAASASGGGLSEDRRIDRLSRVVVSLQQRRPGPERAPARRGRTGPPGDPRIRGRAGPGDRGHRADP
jgi:hypothetical protein